MTGMLVHGYKKVLLHNRPQISRIAWIKATSASIAMAIAMEADDAGTIL